VPRFGGYDIDIFVLALVVAVIVFVVGFVGSIVLKGVRTPGAGALTLAVVLALIGAALTLVPQVTETIGRAGLPLDRLWWPLIGAMVGYFIKR
jgi:ABC-type Fe3+ transport system permease subunit